MSSSYWGISWCGKPHAAGVKKCCELRARRVFLFLFNSFYRLCGTTFDLSEVLTESFTFTPSVSSLGPVFLAVPWIYHLFGLLSGEAENFQVCFFCFVFCMTVSIHFCLFWLHFTFLHFTLSSIKRPAGIFSNWETLLNSVTQFIRHIFYFPLYMQVTLSPNFSAITWQSPSSCNFW